MRFLVDVYERARKHQKSSEAADIKWDRELSKYRDRNVPKQFDPLAIVESMYRPFCRLPFYFDRHFNGMIYQWANLFRTGTSLNRFIVYTQQGSQKPFMVGASNTICDLHYVGAAAAAECLPFFSFDDDLGAVDNISDWALEQFQKKYRDQKLIGKEAVFLYVYAVLQDPIYREKYAVNLKREGPRIPFYKDFWQWADWGKKLMEIHIGYETVSPAKLKRSNVPDEKARKAGLAPKCMLKAYKEAGRIVVDGETTLTGIPPEAWEYRLGNRSALEWILDQYKEKKPKDPTIREKFNTYRFADYKEKVIDLLMRVTTVSVGTVEILKAMRAARR